MAVIERCIIRATRVTCKSVIYGARPHSRLLRHPSKECCNRACGRPCLGPVHRPRRRSVVPPTDGGPVSPLLPSPARTSQEPAATLLAHAALPFVAQHSTARLRCGTLDIIDSRHVTSKGNNSCRCTRIRSALSPR